MISLTFVFYMFLVLFAVIGAMRGWAKELLVMFSALLGMFILLVFQSYVQVYVNLMASSPPQTVFWIKSLVILLLVFFGYQTPMIKPFTAGARKEKLRDAMLGAVIGAANGYLVAGSVWRFLYDAKYESFGTMLINPIDPELAQKAMELLDRMPPQFIMQAPHMYIAIAVAFTFIVIVYV